MGYVIANLITVTNISLGLGDYIEPAVLTPTNVLSIQGTQTDTFPEVSLTLNSSIERFAVFLTVSSNLTVSYITLYHQYGKVFFRVSNVGSLTISNCYVNKLSSSDPQINTPFVALFGSRERGFVASLLLNLTTVDQLIFQGASFILIEEANSITIDTCNFKSLTSAIASQEAVNGSGTHACFLLIQ